MHNHDKKDNSKMMWLMMICCLAPLILIFFFGAGMGSLGVSKWVILGPIAIMIIAHLFSMGESHSNTTDLKDSNDNKGGNHNTRGNNNEHSDEKGHGCCNHEKIN